MKRGEWWYQSKAKDEWSGCEQKTKNEESCHGAHHYPKKMPRIKRGNSPAYKTWQKAGIIQKNEKKK